MIDSPYFDLKELVCPEVHEKYGKMAWNFLDSKLIITLNTLRDKIGKPIFVNSWDIGGKFDERGLRCIQCPIVKDYINKDVLYMSAHLLGKAVDFEVQGLLAQEVREWILKHQNWFPYPIRLEKDASWVHLDVYDNDKGLKIYQFNK